MWHACQCLGLLTCAQMLIEAWKYTLGLCEHRKRVYTESWLWEKIARRTRDSNPHHHYAWLFSSKVCQLSSPLTFPPVSPLIKELGVCVCWSLHTKGSKQRCLLGQNTTCKFGCTYHMFNSQLHMQGGCFYHILNHDWTGWLFLPYVQLTSEQAGCSYHMFNSRLNRLAVSTMCLTQGWTGWLFLHV